MACRHTPAQLGSHGTTLHVLRRGQLIVRCAGMPCASMVAVPGKCRCFAWVSVLAKEALCHAGTIPAEWETLTSSYIVDLSGNRLTGTLIPPGHLRSSICSSHKRITSDVHCHAQDVPGMVHLGILIFVYALSTIFLNVPRHLVEGGLCSHRQMIPGTCNCMSGTVWDTRNDVQEHYRKLGTIARSCSL